MRTCSAIFSACSQENDTGESDKPDGGYTVPELSRDLKAFIAATELRTFHLCGHSLGGAVSLHYALDNEEVVRTLTLVAPVPADGLLLAPELFPLMLEMRQSRNRMREALLGFLPSIAVDSYFEELVDEALRCHAACFSELPRGLAGLNFASRLRALKVPALFLWGDRDPIIPLDATRRMQAEITGSRLEILAGIGHGPQVEVPEEFSRLFAAFLAANVWDASVTQRCQTPS